MLSPLSRCSLQSSFPLWWGKKVQTCAATSLSRLLTCIAWKEYEAQKEELLGEWREGVQQTVDTMKACNVISLDEQHLEVRPLPPASTVMRAWPA